MKLEQIRDVVETVTGLDLMDHRRNRQLVEARALFYFLARKNTNSSLMKIGDFLNKNHATVMNALNKWDYMYEPYLQDEILKCIELIPEVLKNSKEKNDKIKDFYENEILSLKNKHALEVYKLKEELNVYSGTLREVVGLMQKLDEKGLNELKVNRIEPFVEMRMSDKLRKII